MHVYLLQTGNSLKFFQIWTVIFVNNSFGEFVQASNAFLQSKCPPEIMW